MQYCKEGLGPPYVLEDQQMKIGFSLGRCIRDIVLEKVDIDDVLVIVTRTHARDLSVIIEIVDEYQYEPTYLKGLDLERCKTVATALWNGGKIHQPRLNGTFPSMIPNAYVWMDIVPTASDLSEAARSAWLQYRTLLAFGDAAVPNDPGRLIAKGYIE